MLGRVSRLSIIYKELSEFIQKVTDCNPELLEQDMEKLLILFGHWENRQKERRRHYPQAIETSQARYRFSP